MAAIDKLHTDYYYDKHDLVLWCIQHRPSMLKKIYNPFGSLRAFRGKEGHPIAIANFSLREDRYLYWRCPLPFVREYLQKQCGYKDNWFVKLFWSE